MGRYLGEFEQLVLLAILQAGTEANGLAVRRTIEELAQRSVSKGAFYTTLDRLGEKGYVTWVLREPVSGARRHPQRHFTVSPAGLDEVRRSRGTLLRMWNGIEGLLDA